MQTKLTKPLNYMNLLQNLYTSIIWVDDTLQVCWVNTQTEQLLSVSQSRLIGLNILTILSSIDPKSNEEANLEAKLDASFSKKVTLPPQPRASNKQNSLTYGQQSQLAIQFATAKSYQQPFIEYNRNIIGVAHPLFANYSVTPVQQDGATYFLVEIWGENRQSRIDKEHRLQEQHEVAREMLRSVAHEVKNPLAGIRGAAQLLIKQTQRAQKNSLSIANTVANKGASDLTLPINIKAGNTATENTATRNIATENTQTGLDNKAVTDNNMMLVDAEKLTTYAGIVISETDRLSSLIGQLLGSNQLPHWEAVNIHEPLEHVLMLTQSQHPNVNIVRDYDLSLPELTADKNQLIQVFLNLVNNACDAMLEQDFSNCGVDYKPTLRITTRIEYQHTLGTTYHRQVLKVCVHDNGAGIDPDIIERIFFPLVTGRANGTGLGLALVQEMVHRHSGSIEVFSTPNDTAFCIYLPFTQAKQQARTK